MNIHKKDLTAKEEVAKPRKKNQRETGKNTPNSKKKRVSESKQLIRTRPFQSFNHSTITQPSSNHI